jgi:hypothetical protein
MIGPKFPKCSPKFSTLYVWNMETVYNNSAQWCITSAPPPPRVWDIIRGAYVEPLRYLRDVHGVELVPSGRSCYRPKGWELAKGRKGTSLHTFPAGSRGACDLIMRGGGKITERALHVLKLHAPFARICHYPNNGFVHVDYGGRGTRPGRSFYVCASPAGAWRFVCDLSPVSWPHE